MSEIFLLFFEYFKTGLFALGGGMATFPFLYEMAEKYPHWFTRSQLMDMIAVSESTPGPIGVNMATYVGYRVHGVLGSVVATFGLVLPSFLVILIIAAFLAKFGENFFVKSAFYGIRPVMAAMIAAAGWGIFTYSVIELDKITSWNEVLPAVDFKAAALFLILLILTNTKKIKKLHPVFFISCSAVAGIIFGF